MLVADRILMYMKVNCTWHYFIENLMLVTPCQLVMDVSQKAEEAEGDPLPEQVAPLWRGCAILCTAMHISVLNLWLTTSLKSNNLFKGVK